MKQFQAFFIADDHLGQDLSSLAASCGAWEEHRIDNLLWTGSGYMPDVRFCMAYSRTSILLKYIVKEKSVKAVYRQINDPVYKDSCVEMFIAFNGERNYYNLEFNPLGTALVGFGSGKNDRVCLNEQLIEKIKSLQRITPQNGNALIEWELMLNIPFTVFGHHHITSLDNQVCAVNFYKCGDDLPQPHFLSWNEVVYPYPNFHLPEFFGRVNFKS
jgi:Carbohydrate-binding family 9